MSRSLQYGEQVSAGESFVRLEGQTLSIPCAVLGLPCRLGSIPSDRFGSGPWVCSPCSLRVFLQMLQVNEILSRSSVWSAFKDQKHDLFISETQTAGYLTGRDPFLSPRCQRQLWRCRLSAASSATMWPERLGL